MAWYYIVLIVIGAFVLTLFILRLYFGIKNHRIDKEYEKRRKEEEALLNKYQYPEPYTILARKSLFSPFIIDDTPPNATKTPSGLYKLEDGTVCLCPPPVLAIYYEKMHSDSINNYIQRHYNDIVVKLQEEHITFIYVPELLSNIQESIQYNYPDSTSTPLGSYTAEEFYRGLSEGIDGLTSDNPKLIVPNLSDDVDDQEDACTECDIFELNYINEEQFDYVFQRHLDDIIERNCVRFKTVPHSKAKIDRADVSPINTIADEIKSRINQLYAMGVSEYVISKIVALPKPKLSRMLITEDFRIFLPDYNNMEIKMPTLSKALYFFYLRHPEGVLFKELRDHKAELSEIYRNISPREDMEKIEKSIEDIIDSTKNSVNEKCSRIKAAFVSQFNDNLANNYYITGIAGEPKKITLNRLLVDDNSRLICLK